MINANGIPAGLACHPGGVRAGALRRGPAGEKAPIAGPPRDEGETALPDLSDLSLAALLNMDGDLLSPWLELAMRQVERPRANLGSSGPPGRAD